MIATTVAIVVACALLNRYGRGDETWMGKPSDAEVAAGVDPNKTTIPGRGLYYVTPVIGILAFLMNGNVVTAAAVAVTYLLWGSFPWGYLQGLGRIPPEQRPPKPLERTLLRIVGGHIHPALALRHAFVAPLAIIQPWAFVFPFVAVAAYEIGWRVTPKAPIRTAELAVGAMWGALIVTTEALRAAPF